MIRVIWNILFYLANSLSFSRFLKVNQDTGDVISAFQLTQSSIGFGIKAYQIYFLSSDILLVSADGNISTNNYGISQNSNQDIMMLRVNVTSGSVTQMQAWDIQNGNEYSSTIEIDSDYFYQFGMKDDLYLLIKKHNASTLAIVDQKVYKPTNSNPFVGYQSFHSFGMFQNYLITIYADLGDENTIIFFDKLTLKLVKFWVFVYTNLSSQPIKRWVIRNSRA